LVGPTERCLVEYYRRYLTNNFSTHQKDLAMGKYKEVLL
jgi:hypothetical protein